MLLFDVGALAGKPVMEGKAVLFKIVLFYRDVYPFRMRFA